MDNYFKGRNIAIATMHQKEQVIAPLLYHELGLFATIPESFNSDLFGTFSGEIKRSNDPLETARQKCLKAMDLSGLDLAIASEGSFGPHPSVFFAPADHELIMLVDKKNEREFVQYEISLNTNFNGAEVNSFEQLLEFASKAKFPSHGLILRRSRDIHEDIFKGIINEIELKEKYTYLRQKYNHLYVETDMRALYNPTRMHVIEETVKKLITKIKTPCPDCSAPGFSIKEIRPGLKCEQCHLPTRSTLTDILNCEVCGYSEEKMYPANKLYEDPMYCDYCNP